MHSDSLYGTNWDIFSLIESSVYYAYFLICSIFSGFDWGENHWNFLVVSQQPTLLKFLVKAFGLIMRIP